MRIEYQGQPREQVYYTHVGYVSAPLVQDAQIRGLPQPLPWAMMMAALFALAIALRAARARPRLRAWVLVVALVGVAAATAWGVYLPSVATNRAIYTTPYRLEVLSVRTEDWITSHGRAPTPAEWEALAGPLGRDGWGQPLRYEADGRATVEVPESGRAPDATASAIERWRYLICTDHGKSATGGLAYGGLHNWQLGADGLFGTDDDLPALLYLLRLRPLIGFMTHGRQPRARADNMVRETRPKGSAVPVAAP